MPAPRTLDELDELMTRPDAGVIETIDALPGDILVLGAGGKMGYHLSRMLLRAIQHHGRSDRVIAVSRFSDPQVKEQFEAHGLTTLPADLSNPEQLSALPDAPFVFFLAGVKFGTSNQPELLEKMNIHMPQDVAERFRDARIVALSTGCVYSFSTPQSGGSVESDPTDPPGAYAQSCLGREEAFRTASTKWNTPVSLIRLNYAIDLRYGVLLDIAQKVYRREPVSVEMGYVNVIWQADAIRHIIQSLRETASPPAVFNVTGPGVLCTRDLALGFAERFGCSVVLEGTEQPSAWLSNSAKACQLFGEPQVTIEQMMDWTAAWVEQNGPTLEKPTHFEVRSGSF